MRQARERLSLAIASLNCSGISAIEITSRLAASSDSARTVQSKVERPALRLAVDRAQRSHCHAGDAQLRTGIETHEGLAADKDIVRKARIEMHVRDDQRLGLLDRVVARREPAFGFAGWGKPPVTPIRD
jgi:hypothetical protein